MSVPLFAPAVGRHHDELVERLGEVVRSGRYVLGPEVEAFEAEFAAYLGVKHCVGVANGTDALTIALRALGVNPGDEVVLPSLTFYATAEAAVNAGATPVFCDVDPATACVTRATVEAAITERTRAIVPVDLFGNVAPVPDLRDLGLPVLEDAAQAAGAKLDGRAAGSLGDAATFSFFPSKNLPGLGDGGAIVTDRDDVAELARALRFHGSRDKETFEQVGYNSRLDELQAAGLRVLLPELDEWTGRRRAVADRYASEGLGELPGLRLPQPAVGADHAYHLYVVRTDRPDELRSALADSEIQARPYYRVPVHRQPAMARFPGADLPATDDFATTNLALPMGPGLPEEAVAQVVDACRAALAGARPQD